MRLIATPPCPTPHMSGAKFGAYISGEPAWDPDFNCANLFILLPVSRLNARYAKHFMRKAA